MAYVQIIYEVRDAIATVTLNRPERLNAWTPQMGRELYDAFARAGADEAVRVIVVTGAGRGFCAGADMDNLRGIQTGTAGDAPSHAAEGLGAPEIRPAHPALATSSAYPTSVASAVAASYTLESSSSCGTTRFTRPIASASAASIMRPEKKRSHAFAMPTRRGSIHELPCSATRPRRANAVPNRARSDTIRMS